METEIGGIQEMEKGTETVRFRYTSVIFLLVAINSSLDEENTTYNECYDPPISGTCPSLATVAKNSLSPKPNLAFQAIKWNLLESIRKSELSLRPVYMEEWSQILYIWLSGMK